MKRTYVYRNDKLVEVKPGESTSASGLQIMPDIGESFISPVDGTRISSRSGLREHNARNQVVDVGNDPAYRNPVNPKVKRQSAAPMIAKLLGLRE